MTKNYISHNAFRLPTLAAAVFPCQRVELRYDPKMSRKRKVDADGRLFQERWEGEYLFVLQGDRPVCLLCYEAVSVVKEYNLCRHFDTKHGAKYAKASLQEKQQIDKQTPHQRLTKKLE